MRSCLRLLLVGGGAVRDCVQNSLARGRPWLSPFPQLEDEQGISREFPAKLRGRHPPCRDEGFNGFSEALNLGHSLFLIGNSLQFKRNFPIGR